MIVLRVADWLVALPLAITNPVVRSSWSNSVLSHATKDKGGSHDQ